MDPDPIWSHKGHYSVLVSLKHAWRVRKGANSKHCCIKMVFPVLKLAQKMLLLSSMHCTNHTHTHTSFENNPDCIQNPGNAGHQMATIDPINKLLL